MFIPRLRIENGSESEHVLEIQDEIEKPINLWHSRVTVPFGFIIW